MVASIGRVCESCNLREYDIVLQKYGLVVASKYLAELRIVEYCTVQYSSKVCFARVQQAWLHRFIAA